MKAACLPTRCANILIADDQQLILDALESMLATMDTYHLAGTALNGQLAMEKIMMAPYQYDILITDVSMPLLSGIDLCRMVKASYPHILVLILSMYSSSAIVGDAARAGADGYVVKNAGLAVLSDALHTVCSGLKYFSPEMLSRHVPGSNEAAETTH